LATAHRKRRKAHRGCPASVHDDTAAIGVAVAVAVAVGVAVAVAVGVAVAVVVGSRTRPEL